MKKLDIERIAMRTHEINKAYCEAIGDLSQPSWEDAPQWQKDSAIKGVQTHIENDLTPEQSHKSWMDIKVSDGWVYGDIKDPVAKTHPCIVAYSDLPLNQKVKDHLFRAVVKTSLK